MRASEQAMAERRARRAAFLRSLYDAVDANVSEFVNGFELAGGLGMERPETERVLGYLEEKGLIRVDDHREGILRITAAGIDAVEAPE